MFAAVAATGTGTDAVRLNANIANRDALMYPQSAIVRRSVSTDQANAWLKDGKELVYELYHAGTDPAILDTEVPSSLVWDSVTGTSRHSAADKDTLMHFLALIGSVGQMINLDETAGAGPTNLRALIATLPVTNSANMQTNIAAILRVLTTQTAAALQHARATAGPAAMGDDDVEMGESAPEPEVVPERANPLAAPATRATHRRAGDGGDDD